MKKAIDLMILFAACVCFVFSGCGSRPGGEDMTEEPNDTLYGEAFAEPFDRAFNYCPSIMQTDENTRYIFYCTSHPNNVVQDHIAGRKGTKTNGKWKWTDKKIVLAPAPLMSGKFDAMHCCDPSVIQGEFSCGGVSYKYLMAYTGNTTNVNNKVGLAVSNELLDGWVKVENPFIMPWGALTDWGVGQPSLVSVDKKGVVMLFYSVGISPGGTAAERWDLSDLDNPVREFSEMAPRRGLTNLNGSNDILTNGDYAYDPVRHRFWGVSDCHPNPASEPTIMGSHFRVTYISETGAAAGDLFSSSESMAEKSWYSLGNIGPEQTGFPRNHNCGLVTDPYGWTLPGDKLTVYYSMSLENSLYWWTYRIFEYTMDITE